MNNIFYKFSVLERPPLSGEVKEAKDEVEKVYTDEKVYTWPRVLKEHGIF